MMPIRWFVCLALAILFSWRVCGELRPEEIAIIAMRASPQSREIAEYYTAARGIPKHHICLLDETPGKDISRETWDTKTRPAIRRWLVSKQLQSQIRCMVTVWDVPLRVTARDPQSPVVVDRRVFLATERQNRVNQILQLIARLDALQANGEGSDEEPLDATASSKVIGVRLDRAITKAQQRIGPVRETAEGRTAAVEMEKIYAEAAGLNGFVRSLASKRDLAQTHPQIAARAENLVGKIQGLRAGMAALESLPDCVERDQQLVNLGHQTTGLLGTIIWIDEELDLLGKNETAASFDSELSLLYWPNYPLMRWQPNVLHYSFDNNPAQRARLTLMVSRIEAPTIEISKGLIDAAIETEKEGLKGKVYLDARGHAFQGGKGSTGDYDESIRNLAKLLKESTKLEVVLDNEERLFQEGECPDAALYCGWYSLAKYVDAFTWKRGAVAYHIASSEAETLRQARSQVWCKRMLEDGVAATLGPVFEPYLNAFPRPEDFFVVLLSGRYTLVESYYRTKPYNSWAMTLVGDPLYNPFAKNPQFQGNDLSLALRRLLGEGAPAAPESPMPEQEPPTP